MGTVADHFPYAILVRLPWDPPEEVHVVEIPPGVDGIEHNMLLRACRLDNPQERRLSVRALRLRATSLAVFPATNKEGRTAFLCRDLVRWGVYEVVVEVYDGAGARVPVHPSAQMPGQRSVGSTPSSPPPPGQRTQRQSTTPDEMNDPGRTIDQLISARKQWLQDESNGSERAYVSPLPTHERNVGPEEGRNLPPSLSPQPPAMRPTRHDSQRSSNGLPPAAISHNGQYSPGPPSPEGGGRYSTPRASMRQSGTQTLRVSKYDVFTQTISDAPKLGATRSAQTEVDGNIISEKKYKETADRHEAELRELKAQIRALTLERDHAKELAAAAAASGTAASSAASSRSTSPRPDEDSEPESPPRPQISRVDASLLQEVTDLREELAKAEGELTKRTRERDLAERRAAQLELEKKEIELRVGVRTLDQESDSSSWQGSPRTPRDHSPFSLASRLQLTDVVRGDDVLSDVSTPRQNLGGPLSASGTDFDLEDVPSMKMKEYCGHARHAFTVDTTSDQQEWQCVCCHDTHLEGLRYSCSTCKGQKRVVRLCKTCFLYRAKKLWGSSTNVPPLPMSQTLPIMVDPASPSSPPRQVPKLEVLRAALSSSTSGNPGQGVPTSVIKVRTPSHKPRAPNRTSIRSTQKVYALAEMERRYGSFSDPQRRTSSLSQSHSFSSNPALMPSSPTV